MLSTAMRGFYTLHSREFRLVVKVIVSKRRLIEPSVKSPEQCPETGGTLDTADSCMRS